ncbi:hypothetical protein [Natrinema salinisoli]|uniref:hypothetical protein n=1 Tax=Natrinema salinisoli TaxID=2878535 RepID=UPI001CF042AC|nr:hypothetical protein [Natrinema salinisoli]
MSEREKLKGYDPDEVLLDRIDNRSKEFSNRLHEVFTGDRLDHRAPMVRILLVDRFEEQVREFVRQYDLLKERNINRRYAEEFLESEYDVPREDLDTDDRSELLLVIYEHGLEDELEKIMFRSELFAVKNEESYYLDEKLEIDDIDTGVSEFMEQRNIEEQRLDPLRILVDSDDEAVFLQIYREYGRKYRRIFEYRDDGKDTPPAKPSITGEQYYPLKNIGISIEPGQEETKITFTKEPGANGWRREINELFDFLFGIDEPLERFTEERSEVIETIQQGAKEAAESEENTSDALKEVISKTKEGRKEDLKDEELPKDKEEELITKYESIELVGYAISDDQSTSTDEFVIIANNLDNLFETIDGIETSFQDYLEKADEENIELVLQIGGERIRLESGDWSPLSGRISEENKEALERFFQPSDEE